MKKIKFLVPVLAIVIVMLLNVFSVFAGFISK